METKRITLKKRFIHEGADPDHYLQHVFSKIDAKVHDMLVDDRIINGKDDPCFVQFVQSEGNNRVGIDGEFRIRERERDGSVIIANGKYEASFDWDHFEFPVVDAIKVDVNVVEDTIGDLVDRCFPEP